MAPVTAGQADIRGIEVQKFLTGFADEDVVLKSYCRFSTTAAREIRWYQKTSGFISPPTTTAVTSNLATDVAFRAQAPVAYQTVTRQTSYVRKYYMKSELISLEDEADSDVDILGVMLRDLLRGVSKQVDTRIYNIGTENLTPVAIQTAAATGNGWDDVANGNPVLDLMNALAKIRSYGYNPNGAILYINSIEHKHLLNYLINVKGSSIPQFASDQLKQYEVMSLLGLKVVVSENATTDYAWVFLPQVTLAWKQFKSLTSEVERVVGVGSIVHVWEEGEALLENPKSSFLITDTIT
jgi:hypothetical protein